MDADAIILIGAATVAIALIVEGWLERKDRRR